ncbi:hypothetical protein [Modestobacter versicolor]|uniref:hypothetical protein n=1 Tax=Modestobacter versicolor TaxID=429133 RepID=UPI0034E0439E
MSEFIVRREPLGTSAWLVVTPAGLELARLPDRSAAVERAKRMLQGMGGGTVRVETESGVLGTPIEVGRPAGADDPEKGVPWETLAEKAAGVADDATGRAEAPKGGVRGEVDDLSIDQVLPAKLAASTTVKIFNHSVSAAAAMIAFVVLVAGSGTFSAVVTPAVQSMGNKATVGSYITVGQAFWTTLALSLCAAVAVYGLRSGWFTSYGSVSVFFIGMLVIVWFTYGAGFAGPTPSAVLDATNSMSNPIAKVLGAFGVFFAFYGPVPFASGAIAGGCAGHIAFEVERAT